MDNKTAKADLRQKLTEAEPFITKAIKSGNSVEIHPSKEGIRVFEVRKTVAK